MTYLIAIFVYLFVLTGLSIYKSRQVKTQSDFALAGRSLSPWVMVCTMLAVWIGTGSIVGSAGQAYRDGIGALILPTGTLVGLVLLAFIAGKARRFEAYTVPEIIGTRFNGTARLLAVVALIMAYMVIVSYQFNAGGMVLEVIVGKKAEVEIKADRVLTAHQLKKGYVVYTPAENWNGVTTVGLNSKDGAGWSSDVKTFTIEVCAARDVIARVKAKGKAENHIVVKSGGMAKIRLSKDGQYRVATMPEGGKLVLSEPKLTASNATIIAAVFVIAYTMLAGLMSLALTDVVTGIIITVSMFVAFPVLLWQAGGFSGMETAFAEMGDRTGHMEFWGTYTGPQLINFLLPVFLLIMGDANQYQRIFASKNAKGARTAVIMLIFAAMAIELLIIACAWVSSSMIPDPENGRYVLIYAARHFMPMALGAVFMVAVVGIIISTADSFLLIPATTFIKDVYLNHINPKASEKRVVFVSRMMVLGFGIIAWLISLAFAESTTVFQKAMHAYTIYGAAITPCLVAALFWKRATSAGAIASILSGTVVTLVWSEIGLIKDYMPTKLLEWTAEELPWLAKLDAVLPAITISVLALVVISLLTPKPKQKIVAEG